MQRPRFGTAQRASSKQWHIAQYGVGHRSRQRHYLTRLNRHDKPFGTCPPLHLLCEKGKETEKTAPLLFAVRSGPASLSSAPRVHASLNFPPIFPIAVATAHDIACVPCCRRPAVPSSQLPAPGPAEEPRLRTRLPTSPNKPSLLTDRGGSQVPPWSFSNDSQAGFPPTKRLLVDDVVVQRPADTIPSPPKILRLPRPPIGQPQAVGEAAAPGRSAPNVDALAYSRYVSSVIQKPVCPPGAGSLWVGRPRPSHRRLALCSALARCGGRGLAPRCAALRYLSVVRLSESR